MKYFIAFLFFISPFGWSQPAISLSPAATVSVLTCGTGPELYALFGHTAIRVSDPVNNLDVVFNYGTFDFNTEHFALKFVKGDLQYMLSAESFADFLTTYTFENRKVTEQVLDLNEAQRQALFNHLLVNMDEANKYYTYKFIDDNCTTRAIDQLRAIVPTCTFKKKPVNYSYRSQFFPYFHAYFLENMGINIMFGSGVDVPSTRTFLPDEFMQALSNETKQGKPLVQTTTVLFNPSTSSTAQSNHLLNYLLLMLVVSGMLIPEKLRPIGLTIIGLFGGLLLAISFFSLHTEVHNNPQILLFNPLWLFWIKWNLKTVKWLRHILLIVMTISLLTYFIWVSQKIHIWYVLPFIWSLGFILFRSWQAEIRLLK
ncbi:MAG: hypothetical protein CFE24_02875 [Flavobacterium sp. BFFFF2]|nr:MAG: hypothetical protein CFE24_02875 [Flavobacterium sp. BFFFF2]